MLTEAHGIPVALAIDGANRHDMKLVKPTLDDLKLDRPTPTAARRQGLCMDKGYDFEEVRTLVAQFAFTAHIRARSEEVQKIRQQARCHARRWVVERTHSRFNRFRSLLVRWAKKAENYLAFLSSCLPSSRVRHHFVASHLPFDRIDHHTVSSGGIHDVPV